MFQAHRMFFGEEASLRAIYDTKAIICPEPIKVYFKNLMIRQTCYLSQNFTYSVLSRLYDGLLLLVIPLYYSEL